MIWGVASLRGLVDLQMEPRGKTATSDVYLEGVLKGGGASVVRRRTGNGPPTAVAKLPDMSQAIFRQDRAPAHNNQWWCQPNLPAF